MGAYHSYFFRTLPDCCPSALPRLKHKTVSIIVSIRCVDGLQIQRGQRLRFSFHNRTALPQQFPNGSWNCSVPYWPDFKQHFLCNFNTECAGGEDEASCPYTTETCGPGLISIGGLCYIYRIPQHKISWMDADRLCRLQGATLALLKSDEEWSRVAHDLRRGIHPRKPLFIGLRTSSRRLPAM